MRAIVARRSETENILMQLFVPTHIRLSGPPNGDLPAIAPLTHIRVIPADDLILVPNIHVHQVARTGIGSYTNI